MWLQILLCSQLFSYKWSYIQFYVVKYSVICGQTFRYREGQIFSYTCSNIQLNVVKYSVVYRKCLISDLFSSSLILAISLSTLTWTDTECQKIRAGNSLFCSFVKKRSPLRATMSESLSLLFTKEWQERIAFWQRVMWVIRSFIESKSHFRSFALKKQAIRSRKKIVVFTMFLRGFSLLFPFLSSRANRSRRFSLRRTWKRANRYFVLSLFRSQKTSDLHEKPKS